MKRIAKTLLSGTCVMFLAFVLTCIVKTDVKASSPGVTRLQPNVTYSSFELTGDKKKDTIRFTVENYSSAIYINGKKVYTNPTQELDYGLEIITLKNGKSFMLFSSYGPNPNGDVNRLLQYKNGKIKKIVEFPKAMKNYCSGCFLSYDPSYPLGIIVSGNSVTFKVESMNWTIAGSVFDFKYTYKNNTLKRTTNTGRIKSKKYTAAKKITAYKTVSAKSIAFSINSGEEVTISKYYLKNGKLWLQLKNRNGKVGWIKAIGYPGNTYGKSPLFSNAFYAS